MLRKSPKVAVAPPRSLWDEVRDIIWMGEYRALLRRDPPRFWMLMCTDVIPLYLSGTKSLGTLLNAASEEGGLSTLLSKHLKSLVASIICIGYTCSTFWHVLVFLDTYYLRGESPIPPVNQMSWQARYFIALSYLLIDATYPISMVLLVHLFRSRVFENAKEQILEEYGKNSLKKLYGSVLKRFGYAFFYTLFCCGALFYMLYDKGYPLPDVLFWSVQFGFPHAFSPMLFSTMVGVA